MTTPKDVSVIYIYAALYWITTPLVEVVYLVTNLHRGTFGVADTILIPIMGLTSAWVCLSPIMLFVLFLSVKNYPGQVSLWAWNHEKRALSFITTAIFAIIIGYQIYFTIFSIFERNFLDVLYAPLLIPLLLFVRSSIVMGEAPSKTTKPAVNDTQKTKQSIHSLN
ncbi:MAG: hypothetical protein AAF490_07580 [Chloroflexota bacterium]